jgi:hypothetical protein
MGYRQSTLSAPWSRVPKSSAPSTAPDKIQPTARRHTKFQIRVLRALCQCPIYMLTGFLQEINNYVYRLWASCVLPFGTVESNILIKQHRWLDRYTRRVSNSRIMVAHEPNEPNTCRRGVE